MPFTTEGIKRKEIAKHGLNELKQIVDYVICIPNDRITKIAGGNITITEALRLSDKVLNDAFTAVANMVDEVGVVNITYNDIVNALE